MNNKKSAPKKARSNANQATTVAKNIILYPNGTYRVNKMINGTSYTQLCKSLSGAKRWLKGLTA